MISKWKSKKKEKNEISKVLFDNVLLLLIYISQLKDDHPITL